MSNRAATFRVVAILILSLAVSYGLALLGEPQSVWIWGWAL